MALDIPGMNVFLLAAHKQPSEPTKETGGITFKVSLLLLLAIIYVDQDSQYSYDGYNSHGKISWQDGALLIKLMSLYYFKYPLIFII